jgi:plasmid replication initiation protein
MHQIISYGAVIMQDSKLLAIYSQKLNGVQKRYATTERELISDIESCKEYKNILLGHHKLMKVFTVHENNNFNGLKASDRVLHACWLLFVMDFST